MAMAITDTPPTLVYTDRGVPSNGNATATIVESEIAQYVMAKINGIDLFVTCASSQLGPCVHINYAVAYRA